MKIRYFGALVAAVALLASGQAIANGGGYGRAVGAGGVATGGGFRGGAFVSRPGFAFGGTRFNTGAGGGRGYFYGGYPYYYYDSYPYYYGYDYPDESDQNAAADNATPDNATAVNTAVQQALTQRGYYHGVASGTIGPVTQSAIEAFQRDNNLPVTGVIDANLLALLGLD